MKRYLNYLILFANLIIGIGIVIVLILFINEFKSPDLTINLIYDKLFITIAIPIVTTIIACISAVLYLYFLHQELKKAPETVNPRLAKGLKICGLVSLYNFVAPNALLIAAILTQDKSGTIILLSVGLAMSAVFELIIAGFVSYFNLRISFANIAREKLKQEAEAEMHKSEETTTTETEHVDDPSSSAATSGSF